MSQWHRLNKLPDEVKNHITKVMGQLATEVPNVLRPVSPIRTGHLRRSWKGRSTRYQAKIRNTAFYSDYIENGTSRMRSQPMISPMIPSIIQEMERAIQTGTDFHMIGGQYKDQAQTLKDAYVRKYGNYGSSVGYEG